jgi:actin-related protein
LSGGSTLFKNFDRRLERELQRRVDERLQRVNKGFNVR